MIANDVHAYHLIRFARPILEGIDLYMFVHHKDAYIQHIHPRLTYISVRLYGNQTTAD